MASLELDARPKRPLERPTGVTPDPKRTKRQLVTAILLARYVQLDGGQVLVSDVVDTVNAEMAEDTSQHLITSALLALFPNAKISGRWKKQRYYAGITSSETLQKCTSGSVLQPEVAEPPTTTDTSTTMHVKSSLIEVELVAAFREGNLEKIAQLGNLEASVIDIVCKDIEKEVKHYAHMDNILKKVSAAELASFSLETCQKEFEEHLPVLYRAIKAACCREEKQEDTKRQNLATTVLCKCLYIHSERLSAFSHVNGLLLNSGGLKQHDLHRQHRLANSSHHRTIDRKMKDMADNYMQAMKSWSGEMTFVFDNVNKHLKRRHQSLLNPNEMVNMTHSLAVRNRVSTNYVMGPPKTPIHDVCVSNILPTDCHQETVKRLFYKQVVQIWRELIPCLKDSSTSSCRQAPSSASQPTEMVDIGVFMLDETKPAEMLKLLQIHHEFVEQNEDGSLQHKILAGDWLSFSIGKTIQESQAANRTPVERLEGLILTMADFHTQMNLLDLIFKVLYTQDSGRCVGTIRHAINFLSVTGIRADRPGKTYYDSSELFDKLFKAYVVAGGLEALDVTLDQAAPFIMDADTIEEKAKKFVDDLVSLDIGQTCDEKLGNHDSRHRCTLCGKPYKNYKHLIKHFENIHPEAPLLLNVNEDSVLRYSKVLITLGLFRAAHNHLIHTADGDELITLYRYLTLICYQFGMTNYSTGLLEVLFQVEVLPQNLAMSLKNNRFANTQGKEDSNIPLDMLVEHENRLVKNDLNSYRGKITQQHLDKISRSSGLRRKLTSSIDKEIGMFNHSLGDYRTLNKDDIYSLVSKITEANLLKKHESGRFHTPALHFSSHEPLTPLDIDSVESWIKKRLSILKTKHYYKQFHTSEVSLSLSSLSLSD